ncbi:nuclease-related domain-containing protein [Neobacillus sp. FSL H8-0543]|uniref:nuclease-related domain-containing protein n=1 Tax=Neobacillus sp. FSL H8-0543 TaxID=2954672 RepID=UPI0031589D43
MELIILRRLNNRMELTSEDKQMYLYLEKGYEGEVKFDLLTDQLQSDVLILRDLLLEVNHTLFQIDTLIISADILYPCEVKNYEGDYYYESGRLYTKSGSEIKDPLLQLERCESLLRQFLQKTGNTFPLESNVIYVNSEFTLYQAPLNKPIIFPTQLNAFMKKLDKSPPKLTARHKKLADTLLSAHICESPYTRLPKYEYSKQRKGINCEKCSSFSISVGDRTIVCDTCGCTETIESAVLRSVGELKLLFPDKKITTNIVHEWCQVVGSKKMIRRILKKNFKAIGRVKYCYYE